LGAITASVIGGGAFALTASAHGSDSGDGLAQKIADKFNLNKDEVKNVISDYRTEQRTEHINDKLSQAVDDGKISEDQKSKILAYLDENKPDLKDQEGITHEQRHETMKTFQEDFKKWAEDNGIDPEALDFGPPHGRNHGFGEKGGDKVD